MMKNIALLIAICLLQVGCKKEINLNLSNNNENFLVVEGQITDQPKYQYVKLSRTIPYMEADDPEIVSDAVVFVQVDNTTINFSYTEDGIYVAPPYFIGEVGKTYNLTVLVDGKSYTASETMNPPIYIQNLRVDKCQFVDKNIDVKADMLFTPDREEFACFKYEQEGILFNKVNEWSYGSDKNIDSGFYENIDLFCIENNNGKPITVYTYSISENYYNFIRAASDALQEPSPLSPPPGASIPGNISNGALGYFSVASVTQNKTPTSTLQAQRQMTQSPHNQVEKNKISHIIEYSINQK